MKTLGNIVLEFDAESQKVITEEMDRATKNYTFDWRKFKVLADYEKIVKKMLDKLYVWCFECAVHEVDNLDDIPKEVRLSVSTLEEWESKEFVKILNPIKRNQPCRTKSVMICIKKETKNNLMK
ncbi:MAG: hypothetical protein J6M60_03240 [Clostridia bacterium]|nr:hypothetical protein [Clostridia bacterium]